MTTEEFRKHIAESNEPDWFNTIEIKFKIPAIKFDHKFIGLSSVFEYLQQQVNGWHNQKDDVPPVLNNSKSHFENLKSNLESFITTFKQSDKNILAKQSRNHGISQLENTPSIIFSYEAPEVEFLIKINKSFPVSMPAAFGFLINQIPGELHKKDNWIGVLLAYEFTTKEHSQIVQGKNSEEKQLKEIKDNFLNYLNTSETKLGEYLKQISNQFQDHTKSIDTFKENKENVVNKWFTDSSAKFTQFEKNSTDKITELNNAYEELLRLKKPAEYWKSRAKALNKEGWIAVRWLMGLTAFAVVTLYILLWETPEGMLRSFLKGEAAAIKWSIIYVTFISFLAYGIRSLNKVAFSSFHLARDAEEREQLTFVYLAMIKDSSVEPADRQLIMQSLFSRADTGLLKEDSSPTMPGHFTDKITGK